LSRTTLENKNLFLTKEMRTSRLILLTKIKDLKKEIDDMKDEDHRGYQVCYECGVLTHQFTYLEIEKRGRDRPFCDECAGWCPECQEEFAPCMDYKHEECNLSEEDN
jgi:hypothetical protein